MTGAPLSDPMGVSSRLWSPLLETSHLLGRGLQERGLITLVIPIAFAGEESRGQGREPYGWCESLWPDVAQTRHVTPHGPSDSLI